MWQTVSCCMKILYQPNSDSLQLEGSLADSQALSDNLGFSYSSLHSVGSFGTLLLLVVLMFFLSLQALNAEEARLLHVKEIMQIDERKRPYNSIYETREPTEEEMEAYRMKRQRPDDPMASFLGQQQLVIDSHPRQTHRYILFSFLLIIVGGKPLDYSFCCLTLIKLPEVLQ